MAARYCETSSEKGRKTQSSWWYSWYHYRVETLSRENVCLTLTRHTHNEESNSTYVHMNLQVTSTFIKMKSLFTIYQWCENSQKPLHAAPGNFDWCSRLTSSSSYSQIESLNPTDLTRMLFSMLSDLIYYIFNKAWMNQTNNQQWCTILFQHPTNKLTL